MKQSSPPIRVWIVDDNQALRRSLQRLCSKTSQVDCEQSFADAESMLASISKTLPEKLPQVMLLDIGLPGRSGLESIAQILKMAPDCSIVILTVFEDVAKIVESISLGACGYLLKSSRPEQITEAILDAAGGGSPMSPNVARSVVKQLARLTKPAPMVSLSPRERQLLGCLVEGLTAKEIASRLNVSIHTIDTHTRHLFGKLEVHNRAAAVARAMRDNLI